MSLSSKSAQKFRSIRKSHVALSPKVMRSAAIRSNIKKSPYWIQWRKFAQKLSTTKPLLTLNGSSQSSVTLNAANNTTSTAQITNIQPNASGDVKLTINKGSNNTNGDGFYYIGALVIDSGDESYAPVLYQPVSLGDDFIIDWTGSGELWVSDNLSSWDLVTPQPDAPYSDPISSLGHRFYRIEY